MGTQLKKMKTNGALLYLLIPSLVGGFIMPMQKPSGDPDINSIISHVTFLEQTLAVLKAQVQTTTTEMASVKTKLQTTEAELVVVKSDLRSTETDLALLKHDLQKSPDPTEFASIKTELEALKVSYNTLKSQINFTVIDYISTDVKSNVNEIRNLKSQILTTSSVANKTATNVKYNEAEIVNLRTELTSIDKQQNVAAKLATTTALAQSASTKIKAIQSQVSGISGEVSAIQQALSSVPNNTNVAGADVAFQVSQTTTLVPGSTTLMFDTVAYNHALGYDNTTGMFSAPVAGTYIFWANVEFHSIATRSNYIYIIKGQTKLATGYTNIAPDAGILFSVASALTVTHLDVGEQVHFSTGTNDNNIIGIGESRYGGALLRAV